MRQIEEERLVFVGLNEFDGFVGFAVGKVFADRAIRERGDFVGREIAGRLAAVIATDIDIKPMFVGIVGFIAFF